MAARVPLCFYDILSYFVDSNIDVYPVVLGPSMLVTENNRINKELADKIRMNAMAFFEELYCHMKFPDNKLSFFSRNSDFNLQRVIFFDNMISYSATIAGIQMKTFEKYVAHSLALMFSGEYKSEHMQDLWASIENITEDMLNQPKEITGKDLQDLWEVKNFISVGHTRNSSAKVYMYDLLQTLFSNTLSEEVFTQTELLQAVDAELKDFEALRRKIQRIKENPDTVYQTYIRPFTDSHIPLPAVLTEQAKILTPAVVYDYLCKVHEVLAQVKDAKPGASVHQAGEKTETASPDKGSWREFIGRMRKDLGI